jgi:3-oxoacyl-[acyl-carrier-protein] synthase III
MASSHDEGRLRNFVQECLRRELGEQVSEVRSEQDLLETGVLDSMGWVGFLRSLESTGRCRDLGAKLGERAASIDNIVAALGEIDIANPSVTADLSRGAPHMQVSVGLAGSASAVGSRTVPSEDVDRAFGMPVGKLRKRAGIESLAYAAAGEDEASLGAGAALQALRTSGYSVQQLDWIIAAGETHRSYPSLAAQLHSQLLARENCAALDVGGACLGLLNGLAVAQSLIGSGQARAILVLTADVHSRVLAPDRAAGEFAGLFGDGASAFVLAAASASASPQGYRLGRFIFGCAGQYARAIRVSDLGNQNLDVHFDGEALSRAAILRLEKTIDELEICSAISRSALEGLATHQPNPRLVALLAKQCGIPEDKFPAVARTCGNLGASTCGVALDRLLQNARPRNKNRSPIFLASLGPGLLFGGGWLF